jgi:uncharacterized protein
LYFVNNKMDRLIQISANKSKEKLPGTHRYIFNQIDWGLRLIVIAGHRGVGKSTLLLQQMRRVNNAIYLSLDDFSFEELRLVLVVESLYEMGFRNYFLDEAHRYPNWAKELKTLYDNLPDAHFVVTGSSMLGLTVGKGDLSRRSTWYKLEGLSFREFLHYEGEPDFGTFSLENIINNHQEFAEGISNTIDILSIFKRYLQYGYYPFYMESKNQYAHRLQETTQLVLEMDIPAVEEMEYRTLRNMKKLLYIISQSVPFTPNISKLAERMEISRNSLLKMLDLLHQAQILNLLQKDTSGISYLQKPEKIFLQNTNLIYSLGGQNPNIGNIRETFFFNQLQVKHQVTAPKYGDFIIDDTLVFEIGGATKGIHQLKGVPNGYIAADNILTGHENKLPLWLFGFLY